MKVPKLSILLLVTIVFSACQNVSIIADSPVTISFLSVDKTRFMNSLEDTLYVTLSITNKERELTTAEVADSRRDSVAPMYFPLPPKPDGLVETNGYTGALIIPIPLTSVRPFFHAEDTFHYDIIVFGPNDTSNLAVTSDLIVYY